VRFNTLQETIFRANLLTGAKHPAPSTYVWHWQNWT